jgi:hypothetical protein
MKRILMLAAAAGGLALFWKEFPALKRYIKIESM